jgi:SOS-response transcriptional repressor LexA
MFETYKKNILGFYKENRRMPSYGEIMKLTGFKSKNAVYKLINKLVDAGIVSKDGDGKLIPESIYGEVMRLTQPVSAGTGAEVQEESIERLNLTEWLVDNESQTYMVDVQGDSMKDACILDGDTVLVERSSSFKDGQVVVALMEDGYTIKYLRKNGKGMYLEPANTKYRPIYPTEDNPIELIATVKAVIRKL